MNYFWEALNTALGETIEVFPTQAVKYHLLALQKLAKNERVSWSNEFVSWYPTTNVGAVFIIGSSHLITMGFQEQWPKYALFGVPLKPS